MPELNHPRVELGRGVVHADGRGRPPSTNSILDRSDLGTLRKAQCIGGSLGQFGTLCNVVPVQLAVAKDSRLHLAKLRNKLREPFATRLAPSRGANSLRFAPGLNINMWNQADTDPGRAVHDGLCDRFAQSSRIRGFGTGGRLDGVQRVGRAPVLVGVLAIALLGQAAELRNVGDPAGAGFGGASVHADVKLLHASAADVPKAPAPPRHPKIGGGGAFGTDESAKASCVGQTPSGVFEKLVILLDSPKVFTTKAWESFWMLI